MMSQSLFAICVLALLAPADEVVVNRPVPERVTGNLFKQTLQTKISASWRNVELRTVVNRLSNEHQTAVILDRGINPNREVDLDLRYQPLAEAFGVVAKTAEAEVSLLGNTVYIGPAKRAGVLRTLEYLRAKEPFANEAKLPPGRLLEFTRTKTVHWNDLDEPRQIVMDLAKSAGVKITNPENIPHDLWASGTLPNATITEALSLILIQFDLTFTWNEGATEIRLVPIPDRVAVEKPFTPDGGPSPRASRAVWKTFLEEAAKIVEEQLPGASCRVDVEHHRLLVAGTIEQHETLAGGERLETGDLRAGKNPAIRNRQFTLRIERVPASALIKKLEESGIKFEYDPAQLKAKNIDLNKPISMNVKQADADEFFKAICDPLGLEFTIDNVTVKLTPK